MPPFSEGWAQGADLVLVATRAPSTPRFPHCVATPFELSLQLVVHRGRAVRVTHLTHGSTARRSRTGPRRQVCGGW